jgi:hypothetical protein
MQPIQAEVVAFFQLRTKDAILLISLEEEASQWQNIARNHGNIDIILIHGRPSVSLLPSNNAQELAVQFRVRKYQAYMFNLSAPLHGLLDQQT